jgi:hypothetical protein
VTELLPRRCCCSCAGTVRARNQLDVFCFGAAADAEMVVAAFAAANITLVTPEGAEEAARADGRVRHD